ncbi:MAG TPA: CHAP domain-containing protein [Novosphingobium sp.]|nr:CHAP domain-containing protein [Novosphingobium sp.]
MVTMNGHHLPLAIALFCVAALPTQARSSFDTGAVNGGSRELPAFLQCVPYARDMTGVQIYGDAWTWWEQAAGRYRRGHRPQPGAVMAIRPYGNSTLGHVAAVSRVVDSRTVLLNHANWSERGKIETDVRAVDVSSANDWSEVRIWHGPSQALGTNHWPVAGFIYRDRTSAERPAPGASRPATVPKPALAPAVAPALVKVARHSSDPIGDIIAGRYR